MQTMKLSINGIRFNVLKSSIVNPKSSIKNARREWSTQPADACRVVILVEVADAF